VCVNLTLNCGKEITWNYQSNSPQKLYAAFTVKTVGYLAVNGGGGARSGKRRLRQTAWHVPPSWLGR